MNPKKILMKVNLYYDETQNKCIWKQITNKTNNIKQPIKQKWSGGETGNAVAVTVLQQAPAVWQTKATCHLWLFSWGRSGAG